MRGREGWWQPCMRSCHPAWRRRAAAAARGTRLQRYRDFEDISLVAVRVAVLARALHHSDLFYAGDLPGPMKGAG